jgi:hypothetical protein
MWWSRKRFFKLGQGLALLIHGAKEGKDEEDLFEVYMKKRKF